MRAVRRVSAVAVAGLSIGVATSARADISGSAAVSSDYVWRGSSQTREEPAIQVGFKYCHGSGLYGSVWGSNVKFRPDNGAASEFDLALGWSGDIAREWTLDAYVLRYLYPRSRGLDWSEVNLSATWRGNYWIALGHSTNAMASKTSGTHVQVGTRYSFDDRWRIEGALARYVLDRAYADSYSHASASVVYAFSAPLEVRLTLHGTDAAAERLFPDMAGTRRELAVQTSF